jgi:putative transposase
MHLLRKDADFEAFQRVMIESYNCHSIRILSYCVFSSHWRFVVRPKTNGQVTKKKGLLVRRLFPYMQTYL